MSNIFANLLHARCPFDYANAIKIIARIERNRSATCVKWMWHDHQSRIVSILIVELPEIVRRPLLMLGMLGIGNEVGKYTYQLRWSNNGLNAFGNLNSWCPYCVSTDHLYNCVTNFKRSNISKRPKNNSRKPQVGILFSDDAPESDNHIWAYPSK